MDSYAQEYAASNGIPFVAVNLTDTVILNRKTLSLKKNTSGQLTASLLGAAAGQQIVWTSSDPAVAVVSSTGKVTAKGVGKATVTAATADGQYSAACEVTVVDKWIPVESLRLSRHEMSMSANERYQLYFNIFPWNATNRNYTVTSSDPKIVSCNGDTITAKSNGTAVITVTTEDGGLSDQLTVTVTGNDLKEAYTEIAYPMGDPVGDAPALPVNPTGKVALRMNSNWFNVDSREYQQELALLCSQMMTIGYMTKTTVKTMLNGLGFNANSDKITKIMLDQGKDSVNYYYSSKDIQIGEKTKKLVIIGFIGSHQQQWLNNFDPGTGKIHKGFQGAANEMLKILREYVKSLNVSSNEVYHNIDCGYMFQLSRKDIYDLIRSYDGKKSSGFIFEILLRFGIRGVIAPFVLRDADDRNTRIYVSDQMYIYGKSGKLTSLDQLTIPKGLNVRRFTRGFPYG